MFEYDITAKILETAENVFSIGMVKPFQLLVMQRIMEQESSEIEERRNQIVVLPTGTGKSLIFMVPSVLCRGITVIVYPLLALMSDQVASLKEAGIECVCIKGGQTNQQRKILFERLSDGVKIVVTNPETLVQKSVVRELSKYRISLFVLDEAHVISQWGKEFRPSYMKMGHVADVLKPCQRLAFTATADDFITDDIKKYFAGRRALVVRGDSDRENIIYRVWTASDRMQGVLDLMLFCRRKALVFCGTRANCEEVSLLIRQRMHDIDARYYHAGMTKEERQKAEQWYKNTKDGVLCCTCAYGMGINVKSIRTVIHMVLPKTAAEFLQESGRAGRDGLESYSYVIITEDDMKNIKADPLMAVFSGSECRRKALMALMGQNKNECSGCDVCLGQVRKVFKETDMLKAIVKMYPFRFTCESACTVLCGFPFIWRLEKDGDMNPFYGVLKGSDYNLLIGLARSLTKKGVLLICRAGKNKDLLYPGGSLVYNVYARFREALYDGYEIIVRRFLFKGRS